MPASSSFIQPHPKKPGAWLVCLGGGTYEVSEGYTCSCPSFQYRGKCKHATAVAEHVRKARACPACDGSGIVALRERYADDTPLPCLVCDGRGQRQKDLPSEADLRRIFA